MSSGEYEVWFCTDTGERLAYLGDYTFLKYSIVEAESGAVQIVVSASFDLDLLRQDNKIAVWRRPLGGSMGLENVYLLRKWRVEMTRDGGTRVAMIGLDGNDIPRTMLPNPRSTNTRPWYSLEDHADDMCKLVVKEAIDRSSYPGVYPTYFSVQADSGQGQSFKKLIDYRSVREYVDSMCKTSTGRGTTIKWRVVALSEVQYEFQTYLDQIGADRSASGFNPVLITVENERMQVPVYEFDGLEALNYIIPVGGSADHATYPDMRMTTYVYDEVQGESGKLSIFSHRGKFLETGDVITTEQIEQGYEELENSLPDETFVFDLQDTDRERYGRDWGFGDKLPVSYMGRQYTATVGAVEVTSSGSSEQVRVRLNVEMLTNAED